MSTKPLTLPAQDLRDAFELVSAGDPFEQNAWINRDTGQIHCRFPDLGHSLALRFIAQHLPCDHQTVAGFFRRRGADSRFKNLLEQRGQLGDWYTFQDEATDEASCAWCADHDIHLIPDSPTS